MPKTEGQVEAYPWWSLTLKSEHDTRSILSYLYSRIGIESHEEVRSALLTVLFGGCWCVEVYNLLGQFEVDKSGIIKYALLYMLHTKTCVWMNSCWSTSSSMFRFHHWLGSAKHVLQVFNRYSFSFQAGSKRISRTYLLSFVIRFLALETRCWLIWMLFNSGACLAICFCTGACPTFQISAYSWHYS